MICGLSYLLPVLIMALAFCTQGIYPGGDKNLLTFDLKALYLALYGYLSDPAPGFNNLFHSMAGGLGGNIYATIVLCISPLDIIYSFIPVRFLPTAVYFMILFKTGLCGLSLCIYVLFDKKIKVSPVMTVLMSCCYGLMSYNVIYFIAPMWYDCVLLLPLMALALERIIAGKKSPSFVILTAVCIIDEYYIAYMTVIAIIIYFVFRLVEEGTGFKEFLRRTFMFVFHGILSCGLSLFIIIPAVLDFGRGKLADSEAAVSGELIKNTFADVLLSFKCGNYAGLGFYAPPNIFCGSVVTILALIWFLSGKRNLRSRIAGLLTVTFYFASFILGPLDRAWHGFREPICFSVRYAFTFSFFLIVFAMRGLEYIGVKSVRISDKKRKIVSLAVFAITALELFFNGKSILEGVGNQTAYTASGELEKCCDIYENLLSSGGLKNGDSFGRVANTVSFSGDNGFLFGYNGLTRFSSSYNYGLNKLFNNLGFGASHQTINEFGMTPPSLSLLDTGYIITGKDLDYDYYDVVAEYGGYRLYKNALVLPFAYEIKSVEECDGFGKDFFANQNLVFDELFGFEAGKDSCLYSEVDSVVISDPNDETPAGIRSAESYSFVSEKPGHYFFCTEFNYEVAHTVTNSDENGYNESITIIRNYEFEGTSGEYGNGSYSYCVDLGNLKEGEEHVLRLESSNIEVGDTKVYYLNDEAFKEAVSCANGFDIKRIDKKGIVLGGKVSEETDVLVTLPYEDGYRVYVYGQKTYYDSYRDSLMVIRVMPGVHEIVIKYYPPGLGLGLGLSTVFLFFVIIYFFRNRMACGNEEYR